MYKELAELRQRQRAITEVYYEQPGAKCVDEVVQAVGVRDAVDGRVEGEGEDGDVCYVAEADDVS